MNIIFEIQIREKRGYGFQYDELERMKQAQFKAINQTGSWNYMLDHYNESGINYDANGNILSLQRTGFNQVNAFTSIDDLLYRYEGNRLVAVHDAIANTDNGYGNFDFTDGIFAATEYTYDANGNMIQDLNKGITNITYNHLNLPEQITINGNTVEFIYDANGIRHHKITNDNVNISNDYYDGNFHYGEQELDFILTSEGRIVPPSNSVDNYHRYEYHYTDHQNNLRLAYSDLDGDNKIDPNAEVLQSQDYYPFGMEHQGYQPPLVQIGAAHQYTFQGQLKHEDFGLNWSQYQWRNYQPELGRFFNNDRFSEKYANMTTYQFAANNPALYYEMNGDSLYIILFDNRNNDFVYAAETRQREIMNSESYDADRDRVVMLSVSTLDGIQELITNTTQSAMDDGKGETVEFTYFGHQGPYDGPSINTVQPEYDWGDFNWSSCGSRANFMGCNAAKHTPNNNSGIEGDTYAERFLNSQKENGLSQAGGFDDGSTPSLSPDKVVIPSELKGLGSKKEKFSDYINSGTNVYFLSPKNSVGWLRYGFDDELTDLNKFKVFK